MKASIQRLGPNAIAEFTAVQTPAGWGISATFDSRAMGYLASIHGPTASSGDFTDWNGVLHPLGGPESEMFATLVSDDIAYYPFSVTALPSQAFPPPVLLAKDLPLTVVGHLLEILQ